MDIPPLISDLALILISASVTTIVFKWLKQPVILGYIVAGLLVGKQFNLTPSVSATEDIGTWSDLGVTFLMFGLGLEFSFRKLLSVGRSALIGAGVIIPGMIILGTIVGQMLGWNLTNSLFLGGMICMSSTAIIMKAFNDMGLRSQKFAQLVLGILIFEDLIAILLLVIISTTAVSKSFEGGPFLFALAKLGFFMVLWVLLGIFILPSVMKVVKQRGLLNDETLLVLALGCCFLMVMVAVNVGFSSELGAFVMGSIFAETVEAERIDKVVKPLKDLFGAIFFVSVGMMIDLRVLVDYAPQIIAISVAVVCGQIVFASSGLLLSGQSLKTAVQSGFCLTQVGEFAFIIAMLGTNLGLISAFVYPVIVAVSVITIFATPFMMRLSLPAYELLHNRLPQSWLMFLERNSLNAGTSVHNENVWQSLLGSIARIVSVYSILCIAVLLLYYKYLLPMVSPYGLWAQVALLTATLAVLAPFLRAIIAKKNHSREYKYLWASKQTNWAPLMALTAVRFLLAVFFVVFLLVNTFNATTGVLFAVATIIIVVMYYSRWLKMQSIKVERRFFHNLNQREYEEEMHRQSADVFKNFRLSRRLSAYDLHLSDFVVAPGSPACGHTLIELDYRKKYGVHVVSIIRGSERINIPGGIERLFPHDKIMVLGSDAQLKTVEREFEAVPLTAEMQNQLEREVSLEQIEMTAGNTLIGRTIRESGIRDFNKCLVVGIERGHETLMTPDVQTRFAEGDVVWVVGEKDSITRMLGTASVSIMETN